MSKRYGRIRIELRSDLCAGSGYSYAGIIDSDVAYDDYGIPFLPARRLKGCMREAASLVCPEQVDRIFGKRGDDSTRCIVIGNACINHYDDIQAELRKVCGGKQREAKYLSAQSILELYTSVRAQTRIEALTGVADDNTLRFMRVVNRYDPLQGGCPLCFYAEIEYDSSVEDAVRMIAKATRNIGMNRNRGFGSVRCRLTDERDAEVWQECPADSGREGSVCITYVLRNREPLMLSSDNNGVSDSFISGRSILGRLAGNYLGLPGKSAEDEEFRALFLDGRTVFTDANLTFMPAGEERPVTEWPSYYPAPQYLNRMKKSRVLVNLLMQEEWDGSTEDAAYRAENGNLPKKLKTQYVARYGENLYDVAEAERELIYHNRMEAAPGEDRLLYSAEALKEGQYFKGSIYMDWKYGSLLKGLLENTGLSFGKSRTAQYGACELAGRVSVDTVGKVRVHAGYGDRVAVTLRSDAVFLNDSGYTVRFDEVKRLIAETFSIPYRGEEDGGSMVQTRELTGYYSKWNLKRQAVPAVRAGSVFVYVIDDENGWELQTDASRLFVGERNLEGCGEVMISGCREMRYEVQKYDRQHRGNTQIVLCRPCLISIVTKKLLEELTWKYTGGQGKNLQMSASTIGRITLMLKESLNESRDDPQKALDDFWTRICSIKRDAEKKEAQRLLAKVLPGEGRGEDREAGKGKGRDKGREAGRQYQIRMKELLKAEDGSMLKELLDILTCYMPEDYEAHLKGLWGEYMMNILTYHKYQKKNVEGEG